MQRILGLDVGSYSIKASLITYNYKNFELSRFYEKRYPDSPAENAADGNPVQQTLKQLFASYTIEPDQVIATAPGTKVSIKQISLPFKDKKKIDQTIGIELENYIPFAIDEVVYDYQILHTTPEGSLLLVGVIQKDVLAEILDDLRSVGVDPKQVEIDSLNLANLVPLIHLTDDECYAMIDTGHSKTNICFFQSGKPRFVRSIMIGGKTVTEAIASQYKISFLEAERLKHKRGFMTIDTSESLTEEMKMLGKVIKLSIDPLINEISQTLKSFEVQNSMKVKEIFLCGGSYRLINFPQYISISTGIKCSPLKYLDGDFNKLESIKGKGSVIPQSLASALSGIPTSRLSKINFRKQEYAFSRDASGIKDLIVRYSIYAGIILFLVVANLTSSYYVTQRQEERVDGEIIALFKKTMPEYKNKLEPLKAANIVKSKIATLRLNLNEIEPDPVSRLDILREISSRIAREITVDISNIDIEKNKIKMGGTTDSVQSVDKIIQSLESVEQFTKVEKGSVTSGPQGTTMRFTLSIEMEEKE
jgi:type IV pilus assembly protein PilM